MLSLNGPMTLEERIAEFVRVADEIVAKHWKDRNYTFAPAPTHRADYLSDKWVRVVVLRPNGDVESVYAFIALVDNTTKALGNVRVGDIMKPATFKAPAKHARGNVFHENFRTCLDFHGPVYLRH